MIDRKMWILRKKRAHVSLERLSEYLDGRFSSGEREMIERHLEACSECREELQSLKYTVTLLRQMPVASPRRSLTLEIAPSTVPVRWGARAPAWAYGAAASVAILLFALVLSADLSGSLARDVSAPDMSGSAVETPLQPTPIPGAGAVSGAPEAGAAAEVEREAAVAVPPADVGLAEAAAAPAPEAATSQENQERATAATEDEAPALAAAAPPPGPSPAQIEAEGGAVEAEAPAPAAAAAPIPTPATDELEPKTVPPPPAQTEDVLEASLPEATNEATATIWRVLEGVSGGIAFILVGGIAWRMRHLRRRTPS